jgi:hypothetical protein
MLAAALAAGPAPLATGRPARTYAPPPTVQWERLLPGLPTASNPQFHGVPGCPTPTMACIDTEIRRMDALRTRLGCDHRAVFATTYELLTITLKEAMTRDAHLFQDPKWVIGEDAVFANMYFDAVANYDNGGPVAPAWRIAFDAARRGDDNAVQDMLLGINAHVQRDMPFMMAAVGLHTPAGNTHKPDHDKLNEILNVAYARVVDTITNRFDPIEGFIAPATNPVTGLAGNVTGDQLVQLWREEVWRNAESVLNSRTPLERALTASRIEANASGWATAIRVFQLTGYRAQRDRYCAAHNTGPLSG